MSLFKKKEPYIYHNSYKIAGVTFKNEDGTKRQDLLKKLKDGDIVGLKTYEYNGKTAIGVYTCDGKQIGNIKEDEIPYALNRMKSMVKSNITCIDKFYDGFGKLIYYGYVEIHFTEP